MDMRRLIKKIEKPIPKKTDATPPPTEPTVEPQNQAPETVVEPPVEPTPPQYIEANVSDYMSDRYRPLRSVGNSGWQVSDVWRDLRVDDLCG